MASQEECARALLDLADLLARVDPEVRRKFAVDRTVSCRVSDLDLTWTGRLGDAGIQDLSLGGEGKAQVRLTVGSDDLLALVQGRLSVPTAFATGRVRVQASPFDLLRLSAFL